MNGDAAPDLDAFLHRYVDCLNGRRLDELAELVDDVLVHNGERMTREEWWAGPVGESLRAMPDFRWEVEEAVVCGDRIFVRYLDRGTPSSSWIGHEPTGASVSFREYVFYTVAGGRISEVWSVFDALAVAEQMSR